MKKIIILVLIIAFSLFAKAPEEYTEAYSLYKNKDYAGAEKIFFDFAQQNPDHFYTTNCYYWLGMIKKAEGNYEESAKFFELAVQGKNQWKYADALLMVANVYMELADEQKAKYSYDRIIEMDKTHDNWVSDEQLQKAKKASESFVAMEEFATTDDSMTMKEEKKEETPATPIEDEVVVTPTPLTTTPTETPIVDLPEEPIVDNTKNETQEEAQNIEMQPVEETPQEDTEAETAALQEQLTENKDILSQIDENMGVLRGDLIKEKNNLLDYKEQLQALKDEKARMEMEQNKKEDPIVEEPAQEEDEDDTKAVLTPVDVGTGVALTPVTTPPVSVIDTDIIPEGSDDTIEDTPQEEMEQEEEIQPEQEPEVVREETIPPEEEPILDEYRYRDKEEIDQLVEKNNKDIERLVRDLKRSRPSFKGHVTYRFILEGNGNVKNPEILDFSWSNKSLGKKINYLILKRMRSWSFPKDNNPSSSNPVDIEIERTLKFEK